MNEWQRFLHQHGGQGYTQAELSALYRKRTVRRAEMKHSYSDIVGELVSKLNKLFSGRSIYKKYIRKSEIKTPQTYQIVDNGGTTFTVITSKKNIKIYKNKFDDSVEEERVEKLVKTINKFDGYWIDRDGRDKGFTILVKLSKLKYIFIGWDIYSFTANEEINAFYSRYGNNATPYSIAVSKNYTYLLEQKVVIEGTAKKSDIFDLYDDYFNKALKTKKVKNFKLIQRRNLL